MEEKKSGQTASPIKIKSVVLLYLSWLPSFKFFLLCFGHIQSKNEVAPLEVSIFQKSAKTGGEYISADQDRKATDFIPNLSSSNFLILYNDVFVYRHSIAQRN